MPDALLKKWKGVLRTKHSVSKAPKNSARICFTIKYCKEGEPVGVVRSYQFSNVGTWAFSDPESWDEIATFRDINLQRVHSGKCPRALLARPDHPLLQGWRTHEPSRCAAIERFVEQVTGVVRCDGAIELKRNSPFLAAAENREAAASGASTRGPGACTPVQAFAPQQAATARVPWHGGSGDGGRAASSAFGMHAAGGADERGSTPCNPMPMSWLHDTLMHTSQNIFLSAPAGSGKTALLKSVVLPRLQNRYGRGAVWVTATTGVAARHIDGVTIHSAAGVGRFEGTPEAMVRNMVATARARWKTVQVIVIEECSMLSAEHFEFLHRVAQLMKGNSHFFGGVRLVLVGDFMQLPPVQDVARMPNGSVRKRALRYAFESAVWPEAKFVNVQLTCNWRHRQSPKLCRLLELLRTGTSVVPEARRLIEEAFNNVSVRDEGATVLMCKKKSVQSKNLFRLNNLASLQKPGEPHFGMRTYTAVDRLYGGAHQQVTGVCACACCLQVRQRCEQHAPCGCSALLCGLQLRFQRLCGVRACPSSDALCIWRVRMPAGGWVRRSSG